VFEISALTREGCEPLIKAIYQHVKAVQMSEQEPAEVDPRFIDRHIDTDTGSSTVADSPDAA